MQKHAEFAQMERKRTFTMSWDGLGDDDDDAFFEPVDRFSSAVPLDLLASSSDDDDQDFEDSRLSFASAISSVSSKSAFAFATPDYSIWMAAPGSIKERRNKLLKGMGLMHDKELVNVKINENDTKPDVSIKDHPIPVQEEKKQEVDTTKTTPSFSPSPDVARIHVLVRSRSEGEIDAFSIAKLRKEDMIGKVSKQKLTRTRSDIAATRGGRMFSYPVLNNGDHGGSVRPQNGEFSSVLSTGDQLGAFFLIKNLDTGKEFIVNEYNEDGMWNRLSDLQTGKQLTMEEFEKSVGYSPVVKELMRRENVRREHLQDDGRKLNANSYFSKSLRMSKRGGVALLKNIKGVAHSMSGLMGEREREISQVPEQKPSKTNNSSSKWTKVRVHGKSHKELSALHLCQEIQAHEGSIWTMKFSLDSRFLASAGEDRIIHVWEVQECEVMALKQQEEGSPLHALASSGSCTPERETLLGPTEKKKKGKGSKKGNSIPEYAHVSETVFSLSEKPVCSFNGHQDDVLDICWSKNQLLLSASMDKTVRLWDMETNTCLKMFAHNDYVTCIQFNPADDNYFISGSLDAKVRLWSIPYRQVVDWTDIREMITAACFTPDGQGALVGSNKGICRMYSIEDNKLNETSQVDVNRRRKSQQKKITGFQFAPGNLSEVLITSADSRIRIMDGTDIICKFKGFRNTNSQITASFNQEGKYIVCASEDSQVYVWRREEPRNSGTAKGRSLISTQYESFQCKDVSVAIPWNGTVRGDPPPIPVHSKRNSKRSPPGPHSTTCSPKGEDQVCSKRFLPPLPKKNNKNSTPTELSPQRTPTKQELQRLTSMESGIGSSDSFDSSITSQRFCDSPSPSISSSIRHGDSPSNLSYSRLSSLSLFDGGHAQSNPAQATAWGLVIVTGGLEGEIRIYQNFGLPRRVSRQTALF